MGSVVVLWVVFIMGSVVVLWIVWWCGSVMGSVYYG